MAECLDCTDNLSFEDLLKLVTVCDENGNVSWRIKEVEYTEDCHSCTQYESIVDLFRKSLYCDEDGVYWVQVVISS